MSGLDFGNDNSSRYYTIADDAALTLPDGDWCIGAHVRVQDNAGTDFQYLISNNGFSAPNSVNLFLVEDGNSGSYTSSWNAEIEDGSANVVQVRTADDPDALGADDTSRIIILQRRGSVVEIKTAPSFGAARTIASTSISSLGAINGGQWYIGARADLDVDRFYEEHLGHTFLLNTSLTDAQITDLAQAKTLSEAGVTSADVVFELTPSGPDATLTDQSGNGHDATQNGTGWPAASTFDLNPGENSVTALNWGEFTAANWAEFTAAEWSNFTQTSDGTTVGPFQTVATGALSLPALVYGSTTATPGAVAASGTIIDPALTQAPGYTAAAGDLVVGAVVKEPKLTLVLADKASGDLVATADVRYAIHNDGTPIGAAADVSGTKSTDASGQLTVINDRLDGPVALTLRVTSGAYAGKTLHVQGLALE